MSKNSLNFEECCHFGETGNRKKQRDGDKDRIGDGNEERKRESDRVKSKMIWK